MQPGIKTIALLIFLAFMIPIARLSFKIQRVHKAITFNEVTEPEGKKKIGQYFKMMGMLFLGLIFTMLLFFFIIRLMESPNK
ncbi:MAG: hypothetical protein J0I41_03810 [Filimonas sp.]|nr:hypothetical protein [Filimonas sp.]